MSTKKKILIAVAVALGLLALWFLSKRKGTIASSSMRSPANADRMTGSNILTQAAHSIADFSPHVATPESSPVSPGPIPLGAPTQIRDNLVSFLSRVRT